MTSISQTRSPAGPLRSNVCPGGGLEKRGKPGSQSGREDRGLGGVETVTSFGRLSEVCHQQKDKT